MELSLLQILVVVAIIQFKTLKAEVEKGSVWTAFEHGLVDPKVDINVENRVKIELNLFISLNFNLINWKGSELKFSHL